MITFVGIVTAMVVAVGGAAVASEAVEDIVDDGEDTTLTRPEVEAGWDDVAGGVLISIQTEEGVDPCDGVALGRDSEGMLVFVAAPDPDALVDPDAPVDPDVPVEPLDPEDYPGCLSFDGVAEDGKVNHGTMQSMVAKNLSPHDLDIPKGWIMREVAKEKPTKVKAKDAPKDEKPSIDADDENKDKNPKGPKQGKAKGHDREKKGKGARGG
jgi:hypothetical protein